MFGAAVVLECGWTRPCAGDSESFRLEGGQGSYEVDEGCSKIVLVPCADSSLVALRSAIIPFPPWILPPSFSLAHALSHFLCAFFSFTHSGSAKGHALWKFCTEGPGTFGSDRWECEGLEGLYSLLADLVALIAVALSSGRLLCGALGVPLSPCTILQP